MVNRKDCPMRHENGNCLPAGGFCTAVNDSICEALHNAYRHGESDERDRLVLSMMDANAKYQERQLKILRNIHERVAEDTVFVVRCKDCKHGIVDACTNRLLCARCGEIRPNGHVWGGCSTMPENFCSYGEMKDNGTV